MDKALCVKTIFPNTWAHYAESGNSHLPVAKRVVLGNYCISTGNFGLDGVLNSVEGSTPSGPDQRIERLAERLGLDEEQAAALAEAYAVFRSGLEALRDQVLAGELTREEAREEAAILREAFEAQLQLILTPDQWDQLQEMRQNRDGLRHGHRNREARWTVWMEEIGADESQVEAVMAALETLRDGVADLREQVRGGELTREEARELVLLLREDFDLALQEILTPEQYDALMELRPDCPHPRGK